MLLELTNLAGDKVIVWFGPGCSLERSEAEDSEINGGPYTAIGGVARYGVYVRESLEDIWAMLGPQREVQRVQPAMWEIWRRQAEEDIGNTAQSTARLKELMAGYSQAVDEVDQMKCAIVECSKACSELPGWATTIRNRVYALEDKVAEMALDKPEPRR